MTEPVRDWLDQAVQQIMKERPSGEIVVSSGHSPSGVYHIGTLREIMTANALTWTLRRAGRHAKHVDFVDDFDAFRKVPAGVPDSWKQYIGVPLRLTPDPFDCHDSYGAHYLSQLNEGLEAIGVTPDEQISGYDNYQAGELVEQIALSLDRLGEVRRIITEVSGRQLNDDWSPVQVLDEQNNLRALTYTGWDTEKREVAWKDAAGRAGATPIASGRVTLSWRLDWPARWAKWNVGVEPFGRDHATKGGSYDTGAVLVKEIFGGRPPFPVPYEFIVTVGETKKMSKSSGNVLTPRQALEVMPAEVLRYFVIKARPGRTLYFDSGLGLYNLIEEYSKAQAADFGAAMAYAKATSEHETISPVPFSHLVSVYQAAREDGAAVREILERTGYEAVVRDHWPVVARELEFVKNWLATYAPETVKFAVQEVVPAVELNNGQRTFLAKLADVIAAEPVALNGQGMHDAIYAAAETAGLKPNAAFAAVYRVILGQDRGPKAGWFLASLKRDWLVGRLRAGATVSSQPEPVRVAEQRTELPDGRSLVLDPAVLAAFPDAAVGYAVVEARVTDDRPVDWERERAAAESRGLTKENLKDQPEIAAWREVYRTFGVKPSDYRSSVEALTRRILEGKAVHVNNLVDTYNAVSVEQGMPMGAMDLDRVTGDIVLRFGHEGETAQLFGLEKSQAVTSRQVVYADDQRIITWLWNYRDAPDTGITMATRRAILLTDTVHGGEVAGDAIEVLVKRIQALSGATILAQGVLSAGGLSSSPAGE